MSQLHNTVFIEPGDSPGLMMWRASNAWQREVRAALVPHGLTHVQFVLLAVVTSTGDVDSPSTQRDVADRAGVDTMMTSQVLRALEERGYVWRQSHPTDGRAQMVGVTLSGVEVVNQAVVAVEAADRQFFALLGDGQSDFLHALGLLSGRT